MYFVYLINLRHFVLISLCECVSTKPVVEALCRIVYKTCDLGSVPAQSWSSRVASNTNLGVGNPPENHKLLKPRTPQTSGKGYWRVWQKRSFKEKCAI